MSLTRNLVTLLSLLSPHRRWQLVGLSILMLISAFAEMATLGAVVPFLALLADPSVANKYQMSQTVLVWLGANDGDILLSAGILFCVMAISAALIRMIMMWSSMRFAYGLGTDISGEVYRLTLHQSYSWHVSQNSSEILAAIDKVNGITGEILTPLMQGIVAFLIGIGILVMLIIIDWPTALIAGLGFTLIYAITTLAFRNQLKNNSKNIAANMSLRVQSVQEGLGGIRDVLINGTQHVYHKRFASFDYAMRRAQGSNAVISSSPRFMIEAVGMILIVFIAYWLSLRQGGLGGAIPVLGALAIGAQKLLPQMQLVYASWSSINGSRKQLEDVLALLVLPEAADYKNLTGQLKYTKPNTNEINLPFLTEEKKPLITLRNICFRYKFDLPEVLNNINLEIEQGSIIGFIGKTGSGKSTLIDLVMGLLEPSSGEIEIGGKPLNTQIRKAWQLRIAHVPQSIYLSDATIAENIAFGIPQDQIDMSRVESASTKAQLAEFIEKQPLKYKTPVGERGVRLSGGQRQRIGLARALYKKADVLVLDEATSALDETTEKSVMLAIKALSNELTILMIAHRVSSLRDCDKIVELGNKSILRVDNYEALIESQDNAQITEILERKNEHAL
jgi:ABC-type multidrug transport system fused ATPase/permease subunit